MHRGILINGNDHILDNVVVFAALTGVAVNGAANLISATHTWNTQSGAVPAAVGIDVISWQNRLVMPYLDYVPLVCRGCAVTTVTGGFFLGGAQVRQGRLTSPSISCPPPLLSHTMFSSGFRSFSGPTPMATPFVASTSREMSGQA